MITKLRNANTNVSSSVEYRIPSISPHFLEIFLGNVSYYSCPRSVFPLTIMTLARVPSFYSFLHTAVHVSLISLVCIYLQVQVVNKTFRIMIRVLSTGVITVDHRHPAGHRY